MSKHQIKTDGTNSFGRREAAKHALAVEQYSGISRHILRPDLYPEDTAWPPSR